MEMEKTADATATRHAATTPRPRACLDQPRPNLNPHHVPHLANLTPRAPPLTHTCQPRLKFTGASSAHPSS
eukprot:scaffold3221_cov118-Isochrysis_galbana.AAC.11